MKANDTVQLCVKVDPHTAEQIRKMAVAHHRTTAEQMRQFIYEGLNVESYTQNIDLIARIIRQELTSIYRLDDIEAIIQKQADRLAKMQMKSGKVNAGSFFLLLNVLMSLANGGSEDRFDEMLNHAISLGVDYMQKKDFQINSYLQDTDTLRRQAQRL